MHDPFGRFTLQQPREQGDFGVAPDEQLTVASPQSLADGSHGRNLVARSRTIGFVADAKHPLPSASSLRVVPATGSDGGLAATTFGPVLADTIEQLRAVALGADDADGYFPAMYARVTDRVQRAAGAGDFGDGDRMMSFARSFAQWYLRPRSSGDDVPGSWRAAWDVAGDRSLLIVQHLLLGINAHVNHDLPQVVIEAADGRGDLAGLRPDFDAVNAVLADTMPEVLRDLGRVSSWVNLAAVAGGGRWFNFSLVAARDQAWRFAEFHHGRDQAARATAVAELDELVRVLAYLVTKPPWPARWLVPVGRWLEDDDCRRVTRRVLGPLA